MVLEIPTDTRKMLYQRYIEPRQFGFIADPGLHQQLRRMNCSQRYHYFAGRADTMELAIVREFDAGRLVAFQQKACNQRVRQHRQVRPIPDRVDISSEDGLPTAVAHAQVREG